MMNKIMNKLPIFMTISLAVITLFVIALTIIKLLPLHPKEKYYEYIDFQDEWGIATKCFYKSNDGQIGTPICITKDGTVILVKLYKDMTEEIENAR